MKNSKHDKEAARTLAGKLRDDGLRGWFDDWEIKPGDNIPAKIERGLEQARVLVLLMSANSMETSAWVQVERGAAIFRDPSNEARRFIPVRLDDAPVRELLRQYA